MEQKELGSGVPKTNTLKTAANAVSNTADLSIMKSVPARVRKRLAELKELSSARHEKVQMGNFKKWYTTPPQMFIAALDASLNNNVGVITYSVYKTEDGKKAIDKNIVETEGLDGQPIKINNAGSYIIEKTVVETIEHRKPTKVEEFEGQ